MRFRILVFISLVFSIGAFAQQTPPFPPRATLPESREDAHLRHDREKAMNQKRQEDLKRDADKLLQLATELKDDVNRTNENVLSIDVIKKADEIEKLAKSVREKMKAQSLEPMVGAEPPR